MDEEISEEAVTSASDDGKSYDINGISVLYIGDDVTVTQAEWTDNGFDYVISLGEQGVSPSVMTDYVLATR